MNTSLPGLIDYGSGANKSELFKTLIQNTVLATMDAMQDRHCVKETLSIYNLPEVKKVSTSPPPHKVPLVSKVNCGETIALATDSTEFIDCPGIAGKADFAFVVKGNSMENYGIYEGDLVYCKETHEFFSGQTVVLQVQENGESFLVCKKAIGKNFVNGRGEIFECETKEAGGQCNCRIVGVVLAVLGKPL
jgi:SOS-response transcriptional repressor LexA